MSVLVLVPAVHVVFEDGRLRADDKFLSGLQRHVALWDGPVRVLLRVGDHPLPFSRLVTEAEIPGHVILLGHDEPFEAEHFAGADIVLLSGDNPEHVNIAPLCAANGGKIVYTVENTRSTRLRMALLDPVRGPLKRLRSAFWVARDEKRRRRAFAAADGLQFNGYPAQSAYGALNHNNCLYFDGRMGRENMATRAEIAARSDRLQAGQPVRLFTSGRLEPMKGAQDLIPTARALIEAGVNFTLDIFGTGTLEPEIAKAAESSELRGRVRLHPPVDFNSGLVSFMRTKADVFLSCHRQGDPSCSYLEAMGCGLAVIGTDNDMWKPLAAESAGGWVVPMRRPEAVARLVKRLSDDRAKLIAASEAALKFARQHEFESEFARRMEHLASLA